ncbi:MAG: ParB/RepB/Spo0J family partition protein [Pseudomonadota bacterium]
MAVAAKKKNQKGLGRGLDALLGPKPVEDAPAEIAEAKGPKRELPIEFLKPNADQPRRHFDKAAIEELAQSIAVRGMLQPILVRPLGEDEYEIVAGERRWRAAQKAKLHAVPVVIRELTDEETAEIALIENIQRVDLNPVEEARAYHHLADAYGRTQEEIAKAVGKSRSHIANIMRLTALPDETLDAVMSGALSMGHARAILMAKHPASAAKIVIEKGLSVRQTEALIRNAEAARSDAPGEKTKQDKKKGKSASGASDADTRALERDLSAVLGLDVSIDHSKKGSGSITVDYLTLDQLDDICRRLMGSSA